MAIAESKKFQSSIDEFPILELDQRLYPDEEYGDNLIEEDCGDKIWCDYTDKDGTTYYKQVVEGGWEDIIFGDKTQIHEDEIDETPWIAIGKVNGVNFIRRKKLKISNLDGDQIEVIEEKATLFTLMQVENRLLLRPYSPSQMVLLQELPVFNLDIYQIERLVEDPYGGIDAAQILKARKKKAGRGTGKTVIFSSNS